MRLPIKTKIKATNLRKKGYSIKEIAEKLGIAQSTSSLWMRNIKLNETAKKRLIKRRIYGRHKASKTFERKRREKVKKYTTWANDVLLKTPKSKSLNQIYCAILYWAEGGKFTDTHLEFTNSDPKMIKLFLKLLRKGFYVDESKLRMNVHIHEYHNDKKQKQFWSKTSNIPLNKFNKSYLKPHTKKRIRNNYPGCVRICFYSADTARKIKALYSNLYKYV